jgi:DNA-binding LytR/AlgR family response regulator
VLPYLKGFSKRIFLQILFTNLVAQGFIILATEVINALFNNQPLPIKFYTYNLFIFFIWILVINGIYIGMYFHHQWFATQVLRLQDRQLRAQGLEVQLGNAIRMVPFEDITIIFADGGATTLRDTHGKTYILDRSLNKLIYVMPEEDFFRLNRKYIAHRKSIVGYTKGVNGKLVVGLRHDLKLPEDITVSRTTAPAFKQWYRAALQRS